MSDSLHQNATQIGPSVAPKLEVTRGENSGDVFKVKLATRIGRERDNDVVLLDLKSSRYHAEIYLDGGEWLLTDLDSANGTFLNNRSLSEPTILKNGDRINIGETELVFTTAEPTGSAHSAAGPPPPVQVPRRGEASGSFSKAGAPKTSPAPAKKAPVAVSAGSSRLVWLGGVAILILCAVAVVLLLFARSRVLGPAETIENVTPPSQQAVGATALPPTAGSQDATQSSGPEDIPGRPAELALVYEEDFSDSFSGWDDAFDAYTRKVYGNNRYNIEVFASNLVAWGLANRIVSDFEIEVDARLEDGADANSFGLIFRFVDRNNFYRYDISGDGYYLVSKFVDGEWITLVDWTPSEFINQGQQATNVLKVAAFGPEITLWVNGQTLVSFTDDSLPGGNFGFFTGTFAEPYSWVSFDNLKMWTAPSEEIVLIPTATPLGAGTVPEATVTPSPVLPSPTPEAVTLVETEEPPAVSPIPTATRRPSPTPTATPRPLPEYASRSQTLARGEAEAEGQIILPIYDAERGTYDIYRADIADGDNLQLLQEDASQPAVAADGSEIAYRSWRLDRRGLFARPFDADPETAWGFDLFFESARPQFSPVNKTLMYFSRTGGKEPAVYQVIDGVGEVMRRDGAPIQGKVPKWSPDGQRFVYNGCIGGSCGVMVSDVVGGAPALLTDDPSDTGPEISPDGSTIVFMSERAGNWEVYRMDLDGQNLEALTTDDSSDGLPTWSPDGTRIAFVSNRDGQWSVWTMNSDGTNKRRQFPIDGAIDGVVQHDIANSFGWVEENMVWIP
jgi:Tol biopolymer transport system component